MAHRAALKAYVKRGRPKGLGPTPGSFGGPRAPNPRDAALRSHGLDDQIARDFSRACREMGPELRAALHRILTARETSDANVLRAIEIGAAYGFGRPVSKLEVDITARPKAASELTDDEIRAFLAGGRLAAPLLLERQGERRVFDQDGRLLEFGPENSVQSSVRGENAAAE